MLVNNETFHTTYVLWGFYIKKVAKWKWLPVFNVAIGAGKFDNSIKCCKRRFMSKLCPASGVVSKHSNSHLINTQKYKGCSRFVYTKIIFINYLKLEFYQKWNKTVAGYTAMTITLCMNLHTLKIISHLIAVVVGRLWKQLIAEWLNPSSVFYFL